MLTKTRPENAKALNIRYIFFVSGNKTMAKSRSFIGKKIIFILPVIPNAFIDRCYDK